MFKYIYTIIVLLVSFSSVNAQNLKISGVILDTITGEAISNANVIVEDGSEQSISNKSGEFSISLSDAKTLQISHIGYKTIKIANLSRDTCISIKLIPANYLLNTINIYSGNNNELNALSLQNKQLNDFAGMTRDALRAIQVLPGVSVNNEASAKVNVHGGTSEENLIIIDGIEVNEPFHLKEGPATSIGIFNIDMVKNIDFASGAFGAEYGDALSSIIQVEYKKGNTEKLQGKANLSLIDLGVVCEGPLISEKSSFVIGIRKSFVKYLMDFLKLNPNMHLSYYDVQGVLNYQASEKNNLRFSFISSSDDFLYDPSNKTMKYWDRLKVGGNYYNVSRISNAFESQIFNYQNYLFSLTSTNILTRNLLNKISVSYYNENTDENSFKDSKIITLFPTKPDYYMEYFSNAEGINKQKIKTYDISASLDYMLTPFSTINAGIKLKKLNYVTNIEYSDIESMSNNIYMYPDTILVKFPLSEQYNDTLNTIVNSYKVGGFLQGRWQIFDELMLNAGARVDYFDMNRQIAISPRINIAYQTPWSWVIRCGWGIFYQAPNFKQLKLNYADKNNTSNQKALHYVLGIDNISYEKLMLKTEAYYKKYENLIPVTKAGNGMLLYKTAQQAEGYAAGIDFQASYNIEPLSISASYSYLIVREKLKDIGVYYPRFTDQRNTLSIVLNVEMGKGWSTTVRGFYGSGYAYTPDIITYNKNYQVFQWVRGAQNSSHFPEYIRFDLRIGKTMTLFERTLDIYLDVMNIFNRRNVFNFDYTYDDFGNPGIEERVLFPIVPTLGISLSI